MKNLYETLAFAKDMREEEFFESLMERIPLESQANIRFLFDGNRLGIDETILEAQSFLLNEQEDKSIQLLEEKIDALEEIEPVSEDEHFFYYSMQTKHDDYLFELLEHSGKELYYTKENYSLLYQTHGAALLAQERIQEARNSFEKALKWNPYDLETRLFVIETLKMENLLEQFYFKNKELMKMAVSSQTLSIIYQNFAYYYYEKREYKSAFYTLLMSTDYGLSPDPYFMDLLEKIGDKLGNETLPSEKEIYSYFISQGIPLPPDDDLYEFFLEKALDQEKEDLMESMFCLNVLDDIKNSLEKESDDEIRIRKKFNRKLGNDIREYQKFPVELPKDEIIQKLSLTKVHVPFVKDIKDVDEFPCGLVENNDGDIFLPVYIFPSKIPQSQKSEYDIREVPFDFSGGLLSTFDDVDGIVLHPFSKDSFEIRKEEFLL